MAPLQSETWPQDIYQELIENRVRQVADIPDIGHASLIKAVAGLGAAAWDVTAAGAAPEAKH